MKNWIKNTILNLFFKNEVTTIWNMAFGYDETWPSDVDKITKAEKIGKREMAKTIYYLLRGK